VELIAASTKAIAKAIAPFEYEIVLGDPTKRAQICLPKMCFCSPYCNCNIHAHIPVHGHFPGFGRALQGDGESESENPAVEHNQEEGESDHLEVEQPGEQLEGLGYAKHHAHHPELPNVHAFRQRIVELDGPGNATDEIEDYDLWWQLYPGGKKYPLVLDADGDPHIDEARVGDDLIYQTAIGEELSHFADRSDDWWMEHRSPFDPVAVNISLDEIARSRRRTSLHPEDQTDEIALERSTVSFEGQARRRGRDLTSVSVGPCTCGFKGCCVQKCTPSPLQISARAKLKIDEQSLNLDTSVTVQIYPPAGLPGSWPNIETTWSASVSVSFGSVPKNLCDLIPAVRTFIEETKIGGGSMCAGIMGRDFCIEIPSFHLKDFLPCSMLGIGE